MNSLYLLGLIPSSPIFGVAVVISLMHGWTGLVFFGMGGIIYFAFLYQLYRDGELKKKNLQQGEKIDH